MFVRGKLVLPALDAASPAAPAPLAS